MTFEQKRFQTFEVRNSGRCQYVTTQFVKKFMLEILQKFNSLDSFSDSVYLNHLDQKGYFVILCFMSSLFRVIFSSHI